MPKAKKPLLFHRRCWLNGESSASTGSAVGYCGPSPFIGDDAFYTFLEVADCHGKIRLHKASTEDKKDFVAKLRSLSKLASDFANALEATDHTLVEEEGDGEEKKPTFAIFSPSRNRWFNRKATKIGAMFLTTRDEKCEFPTLEEAKAGVSELHNEEDEEDEPEGFQIIDSERVSYGNGS